MGAGTAAPARPRRGDLHVHLFGTGDGGSGCQVSPVVQRSVLFVLLSYQLGLSRAAGMDRGYRERVLADVRRSGLDRAALVGQDGVYDAQGRLDRERTHWLVPSDWVFTVCGDAPDALVPCPGINPDRRDAIEELDRCVARGARLLKIHPPTQGVDIADPRHLPFFRRCAHHDVVVMVHTGREHSAPVLDLQLDLLRLLADDHVRERLVHGSDYPFPAMPAGFVGQVGRRRALELTAESATCCGATGSSSRTSGCARAWRAAELLGP